MSYKTRKRWQVFSERPDREPMLVIAFDLQRDAQRFIDRREEAAMQMGLRMDMTQMPKFVLVDGWAERSAG